MMIVVRLLATKLVMKSCLSKAKPDNDMNLMSSYKMEKTVKTSLIACRLLGLALIFSSTLSYAVGGITSNLAPPHFATSQNREDLEEMEVKVLGGSVRMTRRWMGTKWEWNSRWNDLGGSPDQTIVEAVLAPKTGVVNQPGSGGIGGITSGGGSGGGSVGGVFGTGSGSSGVFSSQVAYIYRLGQAYTSANGSPYQNQLRYTITGKNNGYVWKDHAGNRINYDHYGRMTDYEDRNGNQVAVIRDANGAITEVKDALGNTVISYAWEDIPGAAPIKNVAGATYTPQRLVSLTDYTGRKVVYQWDASNNLTQVTDVLGQAWLYTYSATGELTGQTNPDERVVKYSISQKGIVSSRIDENGAGERYSYSFDSEKKEYTITHIDLAGTVTEQLYNNNGVELRRKINGEIQFTAAITLSDGSTSSNKMVAQYSRQMSAGPSSGGGNSVSFSIPYMESLYTKNNTVTDALGNKTTHIYDQWHNEIKTVNPDGTTILRTWHSQYALPLTEANEKGVVTAYEYDIAGNLLVLTEAKGTAGQRITRYTYDQYGQVETITTGESTANNAALATIHYEYDDYGNVVKITDAEGKITTFSDFDVLGNARTMKDARANALSNAVQYTWARTFDTAGNLLTSIDPYGKGTIYTYSNGGDLKVITAADGSTATLTTNASSLPLTITDANNKITKLEFDQANRLTFLTDANGNKTQTVYDDQGRVARTVDGENNATQYTYAQSQLRSIQYPTHKELLEYDNRNRVKQTTQQANSRNYLRKRGYEQNGNLVSTADALDNSNAYEYDSLNRIVKMTDANSGITQFTYDAHDNLLQVKDPESRVTIYTYNKNNQLKSETKDGDQNTTKKRCYAYDANGNVISSINPEQEKTVYEYDQANHLIKSSVFAQKDQTNPIKVVSYNINEKNQLDSWAQQVSSTLPNGVTPTADIISLAETYTYTNLGQLESVTASLGGFTKTYSYSYYPNGLKKTYTNAEGIIYTYYYNKNNQLIAVHIPNNGQITYAEFNWLMPQTLLLPGGQKITYSYTDFLQVKERFLKNSTDQILAHSLYEYDAENNIKKIAANDGDYNFGYDKLYHLKSENDETFDYDGVGNRTSHSNKIGEITTSENLTYNSKSQLVNSTANTTFTYTASGHTKTQTQSGVTTEYVYNHEERLIAVKRAGSVIAEYAYNPQGQRVKKTVNGNTTWYLYNQNGLAEEFSNTGNLIKEYFFHPQKTWMTDPLFMRTASNEIYYYHNDHLGTPQQLVNSTGQVVWQAKYSAFGKANITISAIENNLRAPGQYFDLETGLHQNYFRDYDPSTGRYLENDPIGFNGGLNNYIYINSSPLIGIDPYGLVAHMNLISPDVNTYLGNYNWQPADYNTVVVHGTVDSNGNSTGAFSDASGRPAYQWTPEQVANMLKHYPGYDPTKPTILVACKSGAPGGGAQGVADGLGGPVWAPDTNVHPGQGNTLPHTGDTSHFWEDNNSHNPGFLTGTPDSNWHHFDGKK